MLVALRIEDELDLADPVIAELAEDGRPPLHDVGYLVADDEAARAESLRILLELAAHEGAAHLAVRSDVGAQRVEPAGRNVHDLLRHAGEVRGLVCEADELARVLGAEDLHAEPVVEAALLGGLHDRGVADRPCRAGWIGERVGARDRDPQTLRLGVELTLVEHRVDRSELAERDAVALGETLPVPGHREHPLVVGRKEHGPAPELVGALDEEVGERRLGFERVRARVPPDDRLGGLPEAARVGIERDHLDAVSGERARDRETGDVAVEDQRAGPRHESAQT